MKQRFTWKHNGICNFIVQRRRGDSINKIIGRKNDITLVMDRNIGTNEDNEVIRMQVFILSLCYTILLRTTRICGRV